MAQLKNHPGFWLRDDAAAAFDAYEAKYGRIGVNSAGRTKAEQQKLIDRWNKGGAANRPPYLYRPGMPASTSPHVIDGGIAVDVSDYRRFEEHSEEFGFHWFGSGDPVHFNFRGWSGQGAGSKFSQVTADRQAWLNSRGWNLKVDGIQGPATTRAIREYQTQLRDMSLYSGQIDGLWGSGTQSAHQRFYDSVTGNAPKTGALTYADIQRGLNKFGYGLVVDGVWGKKSHNALGDFQRKNGLKVDYLVGPQTRAKLGI